MGRGNAGFDSVFGRRRGVPAAVASVEVAAPSTDLSEAKALTDQLITRAKAKREERRNAASKAAKAKAPTTSSEFVYGCFSASVDGIGRPFAEGEGLECLMISLKKDWLDEGRVSDYYDEGEMEFITNTFAACNVPAFELMESSYELDGMSADEAREALRGAPQFTHDADFEKFTSY